MNGRLAHAMTRLYPARWRERYGAEFAVFLESDAGGLRSVVDVVGSAIREHILSAGGWTMNRPESAVGLVVSAFFLAVAGGINLVATVDDSPLVRVMRSDSGVGIAWNLLAVVAVITGAAVILLAFPLYRTMLRLVWTQRRRDVLLRLCVPAVGFGVLLLWGAVGFAHSGGTWVPTPWAIFSKGGAPSGWPDLPVRWISGVISVVLCAVVVVGSGISFLQAIRLTSFEFPVDGWSLFPRGKGRLVGLAILLVSAGTLLMTFSVLLWGALIQTRVPELFGQQFGLLGSTGLGSWLISLCLFAVASVISIHGARAFRANNKEHFA